jgi:hypothetical protein
MLALAVMRICRRCSTVETNSTFTALCWCQLLQVIYCALLEYDSSIKDNDIYVYINIYMNSIRTSYNVLVKVVWLQ